MPDITLDRPSPSDEEDLLTRTFAAHESLVDEGRAATLMAAAQERTPQRSTGAHRRLPATLVGVAAAGALVAGALGAGGMFGAAGTNTPASSATSAAPAASAAHPIRLDAGQTAALWEHTTAAVERAGTMTIRFDLSPYGPATEEVDLRDPAVPRYRVLVDGRVSTLSIGRNAWERIWSMSDKPTRLFSRYIGLDRASVVPFAAAGARRNAVAWDLGPEAVAGTPARHYRFVADRDEHSTRLTPTPAPTDGRDVSDVWIDATGRIVRKGATGAKPYATSRITYGAPVSITPLPKTGIEVLRPSDGGPHRTLFVDDAG